MRDERTTERIESMTITEFLLARIAEDEELARAADHAGSHWQTTTTHGPIVAIDNGTEWGGEPVVYDEGSPSEDQAAHIARHDPARVLAECAAKRRIVEQARSYRPESEYGDTEGWALVDMVRILAAIWADHPDYDTAWAV